MNWYLKYPYETILVHKFNVSYFFVLLIRGGLCVSESVIDGCLLNNGSVMNSSDSSNMKVWIDEIMCEGIEQNLAECRRNHWGEVDCFHKEDAGCICQPLPTADDG